MVENPFSEEQVLGILSKDISVEPRCILSNTGLLFQFSKTSYSWKNWVKGDSEVAVMAPCYLTSLNILILNTNGKGNPFLFSLQKQPNIPMLSLLCLLLLASHWNSSFWNTNYHISAFHTFPQVLNLLSSMEWCSIPQWPPSSSYS